MSEKTGFGTEDTTITNSKQDIIEERSNKMNGQVVRRYSRGKFLGKGGFAKCYQITNMDTKKISAIKIVSKQTLKKAKAKQKLISEIKIHKQLRHKHVVCFDHVFEDKEHIYIVLQLCKNHTLSDLIRKRRHLSELEVQYYIHQIINGIMYVHSSKVIHRDLKLGNLMINENMEVKIGDFGLAAKIESNEKRRTICGTPNYIAPEIIDGKAHSYEVDIWSLGVIIYALIYGKPPFETNQTKKTYKKIKDCQYTFNDGISVSSNAKNLISRILINEPSKRLTLEQIINHPFMCMTKLLKTLPIQALTSPLSQQFFNKNTQSVDTIRAKSSAKIQSKILQSQIDNHKLNRITSSRFFLRQSNGLCKKNNWFKNNKKQDSANIFYNTNSKQSFSSFSNYFIKQNFKINKQNQINIGEFVLVKKWVDYSSKYGLGYLLSDGSMGIYFNDNTKMCLSSNQQNFDYITQDNNENIKLYSFLNNSVIKDHEINKKITLMHYFSKYLNEDNEQKQKKYQKQQNIFYYIKKWIKSQQAILFRLNNSLIQINFFDKSQLIIYGNKQIIHYTTNKKQKISFNINGSDQPNSIDLISKMKHVKLLLYKIKKNNIKKNNNQQDIFPINTMKNQ